MTREERITRAVREKVNDFEWEVYKAVCTLVDEYEENVFSASRIIKLMSGGKEKYITNAQRQEIDNAMKKMNATRIEFDVDKDSATPELLKWLVEEGGITDFTELTEDISILSTRVSTMGITNGITHFYYNIVAHPQKTEEIKQLTREEFMRKTLDILAGEQKDEYII